MTDTLDRALLEAYELIEANRIDEARTLLEPLLDQYPDDPDLWWVYSHAVDNEADARAALQRVLQVDPNFTDAAQLLNNMGEAGTQVPAESTGVKPLKSIKPLGKPADSPSGEQKSIDDPFAIDFEGDDFEDEFDDDLDFGTDTTSSTASGGRNWLVLGGIGLVLVVIFAVIMAQSLSNVAPPPPTDVVVNVTNTPISGDASSVNASATSLPTNVASLATTTPEATETEAPTATATATAEVTDTPDATETSEATETEAPTDTPEATETEAPTDTPEATETEAPRATREATETETPTDTPAPTNTPSPTPEPFAGVAAVLTNADLSGNALVSIETALGDTLVIEFCLDNDVREELLDSAFDELVEIPIEDIEADAIAVSIYDCDSDDTLRVIGVNLEDLQAFRDGDLNNDEFQLTWQVVG